MSPERIKELFDSFSGALRRLEEALGEDISRSSTLVDGTIQRFEFTFELAWKTMKDYLELMGFTVVSPRDVIKQAFQTGYITDGAAWLDALDKRNLMAYIYQVEIAEEVIDLIKNKYFNLLDELHTFFLNKLPGMK